MPGFISVSGGKLTTYRSMAAEVVDAAERSLGRRHVRAITARRYLPGGDLGSLEAAISRAAGETGDALVAERLVRAYGSNWRQVWAIAGREPLLGARVTPERPYVLAELRHAVEAEMAMTLGDLLIRRTPVAFEAVDHGRSAARRVLELVRGWLGERREWESQALEAYEVEVDRMFAVG